MIHWEEYHDYTDDDILNIYKEKENLESSKKFIAENYKENLAQVYTEIRYKSSDSVFFSNKLMKMLTDQGFSL
jgi:hypothetical protein